MTAATHRPLAPAASAPIQTAAAGIDGAVLANGRHLAGAPSSPARRPVRALGVAPETGSGAQ